MVQASYAAAQVPVGTVPVTPPSTTSANSVNQAVTEVLTLRLAPRRKAKAPKQAVMPTMLLQRSLKRWSMVMETSFV
ncbi:hypothetical protein WJX82_010057 [Trebouxia sp. C0006]